MIFYFLTWVTEFLLPSSSENKFEKWDDKKKFERIENTSTKLNQELPYVNEILLHQSVVHSLQKIKFNNNY